MTGKAKWLEVWIDTSSDGESILILRAMNDGTFEVTTPFKSSWRQVFNEYDEAVHFLREDEFDIVEGRWSLDEEDSEGQ